MFLYVCKQTFCKFYGLITREFLGLKIWSFQGIIFIWTRTYSEVFKSALVSFKFVHIKTFGGVLVKSKFSKQWMCYLQAWNHTWTNLICKVFYSNMSCLCFYASKRQNCHHIETSQLICRAKGWVKGWIFLHWIGYLWMFLQCPNYWLPV